MKRLHTEIAISDQMEKSDSSVLGAKALSPPPGRQPLDTYPIRKFDAIGPRRVHQEIYSPFLSASFFGGLGLEPPGWQGAKMQEYLDIPTFRNTARRDAYTFKVKCDASAHTMRSYF